MKYDYREYDGHYIVFSSGREFPVVLGMVGLSLDGECPSAGCDGPLFWGIDGHTSPDFGKLEITQAERRELADHMMKMWDEWGNRTD